MNIYFTCSLYCIDFFKKCIYYIQYVPIYVQSMMLAVLQIIPSYMSYSFSRNFQADAWELQANVIIQETHFLPIKKTTFTYSYIRHSKTIIHSSKSRLFVCSNKACRVYTYVFVPGLIKNYPMYILTIWHGLLFWVMSSIIYTQSINWQCYLLTGWESSFFIQ